MRIRLLGDHSAYHAGSAAAFAVIRDEAARHGTLVTDEDFDVIVVNGEGSMHDDSKSCLEKANAIAAAVARGKRAVLVNSLWQHNSAATAKLISGCSQIVAREVLSQRELQATGLAADMTIDQSFHFPVDHEGSDSIDTRTAITDFYAADFGRFVRIQGSINERYHYIDMSAMPWTDIVRAFRHKKLLLTGRHHAVYAACRARLPFLATKGNTHKIEGLIASAGVDIPVFATFRELQQNLDWPRNNRDRYERLFDWMERQPPWTLSL